MLDLFWIVLYADNEVVMYQDRPTLIRELGDVYYSGDEFYEVGWDALSLFAIMFPDSSFEWGTFECPTLYRVEGGVPIKEDDPMPEGSVRVEPEGSGWLITSPNEGVSIHTTNADFIAEVFGSPDEPTIFSITEEE